MTRPVLLVDFGGVLVETAHGEILDVWRPVPGIGSRGVIAATLA